MKSDITEIRPYEICSIRPPTEKYSLTFRLTRNCYWNKCKFCPVYKFGAKFSKRTTHDVLEDIGNAKKLDDFMYDCGIGYPIYSEADYQKAGELINQIKKAWWEAGIIIDEDKQENDEDLDPRIEWFLQWFKDKPSIEDSINNLLTWRIGGATTCFLGDADSLILKPDYLKSIIPVIKKNFPTLERFTIYGRTRSASQLRTPKELKEIFNLGVKRVHFGLESGNDKVLELIEKGITKDEQIKGLAKTKEAGLSPSVYIMPGLGGNTLSEIHALDTADVINKSHPEFVRLRSLEIFPGTELESMATQGSFTEATEEQIIKEIQIMVQEINVPINLYSDSASNLLPINGKLPQDRKMMLEIIDNYLNLSDREKKEFSLQSRIESFYRQYGSITEDIQIALKDYIIDNKIDLSIIPYQSIIDITRMIRGKLMP